MGMHAVRNASGSKRWMNCPGSINLVDELRARGLGKSGSSPFARLGTAAHGLCETSVAWRVHPSAFVGGTVFLDGREDAHVLPPPDLRSTAHHHLLAMRADRAGSDWEAFPIDANMADAVAVYYETVVADLEEAGPSAELMIERRFDLNWLVDFDVDLEALDADPGYVSPSGIRYVPDEGFYYADGGRCHGPMFGTNDAAVYVPFDLLRVYDYKHGQGVVVEVEDNSQELYYALGIAREVDWAFGELELVIVQPRAPHSDGAVRRWRCSVERLRAFEAELRQAARRTEDPDAGLKAGEWCGFCPAAPYCSALRERAFEAAALDFSSLSTTGGDADRVVLTSSEVPGPLTSDDDLRTSLEAVPLLDAFVKAVETEALRRLREAPGGEAFGHKLVRKRSIRQWRKDAVVEVEEGELAPVDPLEHLETLGFPREMLYEAPKPKGPAKVEALRPPELISKLKELGVKSPVAWIKQQVAELTYKPEGGVTIAHESDPRPAVDPTAAALSDFDAVEDESAD